MSRPTGASITVIIVSAVVMFCFVVAAVTGLAIFAPEGSDVGAITTALLGSLATVIPILVTLAKVQGMETRQSATDEKVNYLANGGMDSKIRAGVADVLPRSMLKDDVDDLLAADRAHREAGPEGSVTRSSDSSSQPIVGQDDVALSGIDARVPEHRRD